MLVCLCFGSEHRVFIVLGKPWSFSFFLFSALCFRSGEVCGEW